MNKWVETASKEVMDSAGSRVLIEQAIGHVCEVEIPQSVLSVGCGDGTEMQVWLRTGCSPVHGIDLNDESLAKCKAKDLKVFKLDMHEIDFDVKYDMVFARDVFEHSPSPLIALESMVSASKKYVCIVLPDETWMSSHWHYQIPTLKQMINYAEKADTHLRLYREYTVVIGNTTVTQSLYLLEKNK